MRTRTTLVLLALLTLLAGCATGDAGLRDAAGGTLEGTDWVLTLYEQDGALTLVPDGLFANAEFAAHRIRGFSGCNEYSALYRAGGRTLLISQPSSTNDEVWTKTEGVVTWPPSGDGAARGAVVARHPAAART